MSRKTFKESCETEPEASTEREVFKSFLASRGLRMTRQRVLVFDAVFRVHGHVDAEELAGHLRKPGSRVSRASVYRTLDLLAEAGLVKPTRLGERQRFYEHVHGGEHHDHLVCEVCGRLIEFYSPEIEKLQEKVCRENSFEPARHTMIVYGVCEECRRKKTVR